MRLDPSVDPSTPIGELLGREGIRVCYVSTKAGQKQIGIGAPLEFKVLRDELVVSPAPTDSN